MANTAQLFRRQSSRDLSHHNGSHRDYTKTLDELELKVEKNSKENFVKNLFTSHSFSG